MLLLSLALPAFSAPEAEAPQDLTLEGRLIKYRERDEIDFEDVEVSATVDRPGVIKIDGRAPISFHPMVWIRTDWAQETQSSADQVK